MANYFTLCERIDGKWHPQYGSYTKRDCLDEIQSFRDSGIKAKDLTIIRTGDSQASVNAGVAHLNNPKGV